MWTRLELRLKLSHEPAPVTVQMQLFGPSADGTFAPCFTTFGFDSIEGAGSADISGFAGSIRCGCAGATANC